MVVAHGGGGQRRVQADKLVEQLNLMKKDPFLFILASISTTLYTYKNYSQSIKF